MPWGQSDIQSSERCLIDYSKAKGFTLIEIMAVIFVVGILLAIVSLNMGGRSQRQLDLEAQQLVEQIRYAIEESQISRNEFGFKILEEKEYQFYHFDDQTMDWIEDNGHFLKPIELFKDHIVEVDQSESVDPILYKHENKDKVTDYGDSNRDVPDIIFYSDGTVSPFIMSIFDKNEKDIARYIRVDREGKIVVSNEK